MESTKLKNYIKYGYRSSNNVLKRKITIFKFYLLEVLFILTYPLAILGPMIRLAYYKTYIDTRNSKKFRLFNSFNEFNNNKRLVTLILSSLLQKLILLGILLVLALICLMIYLISLGLYLIVKDSMVYIITVIPFVILSIGYLYYIFFLVIPVEQILLVEPSTNVSKVLRMSFQSASRDSKHKYLVFIGLFELIVLAIFITALSFGFPLSRYSYIVCAFLLIIFLLVIPRFIMSHIFMRISIRDYLIKNDLNIEIDDFNNYIFNKDVKVLSDLFVDSNNEEINKDLNKKKDVKLFEDNVEEFDEKTSNDLEENEDINENDKLNELEDKTNNEVSNEDNNLSNQLELNDNLDLDNNDLNLDNDEDLDTNLNIEDNNSNIDTTNSIESNNLDDKNNESIDSSIDELLNYINNLENKEANNFESVEEASVNETPKEENQVNNLKEEKKETKPRVKKTVVKKTVVKRVKKEGD